MDNEGDQSFTVMSPIKSIHFKDYFTTFSIERTRYTDICRLRLTSDE